VKHLCETRKLGRDSSHRIATMRALALALIENETIKTTVAKAKELRRYAERLLTLAKRGDLHSRRLIVSMLGSTITHHGKTNRVRTAIAKLYSKFVPRFKSRNGGYTQIFRVANRRVGDNAELAIIRYIPPPEEKKKKGPQKPTKKKTAKSIETNEKNSKSEEKEELKPIDKKEELKSTDKKEAKKPNTTKKKTSKKTVEKE